MSRGQAAVPVLAVGVLILLGAAAVGVLGAAHAAAARAQRAADLAALSAARELVARLGRGPGPAGAVAAAARAAAAPSAVSAGGRVERVDAVGAWPPVAVDVEVAVPGPLGTVARARARAGLDVRVALAAGTAVTATGGGYAGPLVHRDGKPTCPQVAAAFDVMDAAARADGIDLVVVSGYRSDAEQAVLFARHPDPRWVAPPGRSRHRDATELDLATGGGAGAWLARNATRFGFAQRYSWEPWHFGYLPGCGTPRTGTPAVAASPGGLLPEWVPARYRDAVAAAALANGVPPAVLAALLQAESGYRPDAVSPAGALGIAQFMPGTAAGVGLRDPFDPAQAIPAAGRLLGGHIRAFGSVPLALAAYNAGPGAVRRYGGVPPYAETRAYVARIMALAGGAAALAPGSPSGAVVLLPIPA